MRRKCVECGEDNPLNASACKGCGVVFHGKRNAGSGVPRDLDPAEVERANEEARAYLAQNGLNQLPGESRKDWLARMAEFRKEKIAEMANRTGRQLGWAHKILEREARGEPGSVFLLENARAALHREEA